MTRISVPTLFGLLLAASAGPSFADDWRSKYSTRGPGAEFEACCGIKDCHTAEALGHPEIKRRGDGGYNVRINGYWLEYDHPAVHVSEDSKTWICYMDSNAEPDPLCIFLPPGTI